MSMPFYASAEQIMRDRSEFARKGIARGRSVVVLLYADGVLFVAESISPALHKVSEIYDRIGFAAVGKYNEFENLRVAGIRLADLRGYSYDRRDVTARALANAYAQTLGTIFTEQQKPYEVEICVAEVGSTSGDDQLYRLSYDGTIANEPKLHGDGRAGGRRRHLRARRLQRRPVTAGCDRPCGTALGSVGGENGASRVARGRRPRGGGARPQPGQAQIPSDHRGGAGPACCRAATRSRRLVRRRRASRGEPTTGADVPPGAGTDTGERRLSAGDDVRHRRS